MTVKMMEQTVPLKPAKSGYKANEFFNLEEADLAQKRAEALLRKSAMESVGGQIIVPLNCGQELYDVITISDGRCGISNRKYRVLGIESRYDCLQNIYQQKLMLGAL